MEIVQSDVQPEKMQPVLQTLTPYLNQSLKSYFDREPARVLSTERSKAEAMAKNWRKALKSNRASWLFPLPTNPFQLIGYLLNAPPRGAFT